VCLKNANTGDGHAIIAENNDGNVQFLDVQVGKYYNKNEATRQEYDNTLFFRIDNAIISQRGVNACEKE
jgi:hypothetical protein